MTASLRVVVSLCQARFLFGYVDLVLFGIGSSGSSSLRGLEVSEPMQSDLLKCETPFLIRGSFGVQGGPHAHNGLSPSRAARFGRSSH